MSTLEEFNSDISEYLPTLKARNGIDMASQNTRTKWQKVLERIALVLAQHGHEIPDEKDYEEYRANNTMSDETFETYKKGMDNFFSWRKDKERRQEIMPEETIASEVSAENAHAIEAEPAEAEAGPVERKSNTGRKKFDTVNGEKRKEKLMLYLTPTVIANLRDWCSLKNLSANNYVTELIEADLRDKQDKLDSFRQLRDEA